MDYTLANKTFDKYELVIKRLENLVISLNTQLVEAKDKLSRRNMQIKDLKKFKEEIKKQFYNTQISKDEFCGTVETLLNNL